MRLRKIIIEHLFDLLILIFTFLRNKPELLESNDKIDEEIKEMFSAYYDPTATLKSKVVNEPIISNDKPTSEQTKMNQDIETTTDLQNDKQDHNKEEKEQNKANESRNSEHENEEQEKTNNSEEQNGEKNNEAQSEELHKEELENQSDEKNIENHEHSPHKGKTEL